MFELRRFLQGDRTARIRFGRGVLGNTTYALGAALASAVMVAWAFKGHPGYGISAIIVIFVVYLVFLVGTYLFASKHPDLAMLADSELVQYWEHKAAISGLPDLPDATSIIDPEASTTLPPPSKDDGS